MARKIFSLYQDEDRLKLVITTDDGSPELVANYSMDDRHEMQEAILHCLHTYDGDEDETP